MAHNKARKNERNLIRNDFEYNYVADSFKGVDFSSIDGQCDDTRLPFLVNMYHDKEKENSASLETIPGYRKINKTFLYDGEIYGIYSHSFLENGSRNQYVLVHKGRYLYVFLHNSRDTQEELTPLIELNPDRSCGFSYGGYFYLLDRANIVVVKNPKEAMVLGDQLKAGVSLPETTAYIPTTHQNNMPREARNMLTGYFDLTRRIEIDSPVDEKLGLFYRLCEVDSVRGLEVYGMEAGRRILFVPEYAYFEGEELPVLRVAEGAFSGRNLTQVILSPSVKEVGKNAFSSCRSLKRVCLFGVKRLEERAFYGCVSLKVLTLGKSISSIGSAVFAGVSSAVRLFYEGEELDAFLSVLPATVTIYPDTIFAWVRKGDVFYIPCNPIRYPNIVSVYGGERKALSRVEEYYGIEVEGEDLTEGYAVLASSSAPCAQYFLKGASSEDPSRYLFVSVTDEDGMLDTKDAVESFRIDLPEKPEALVFVTLDGSALLPDETNKEYYLPEMADGRYTAIRVLLSSKRRHAMDVRVRCYDKKSVATANSFTKDAPYYKSSLYNAIRFCRMATVFDGKVFFSGNPALPDTVFYSVAPKEESEFLMFAPSAYLSCYDTDGEIVSLMSHPLYLAVLKNRSLYAVSRAEGDAFHERYAIDGSCASAEYYGASYTFGDEPLYLSSSGVMALASGKAWEESRIENRSYYIDRRLKSLSHRYVAFAEWQGYLVFLIDGKIFLGDASAAEKKNGSTAYEWYYLEGIGHYEGQHDAYHYCTNAPIVEGKRLSDLTTFSRRLAVKEREAPVLSEVVSAIAEENYEPCGIRVYYTPEFNEEGELVHYLVDTDGRQTGGVFSPAVRLLSLENTLYFGTLDGYLFCFNNDKRGKAVTVNGETETVGAGEIHPSYYTFDGRAYPCGLATAMVDMGVPHLSKSTVRKSLVISAKSFPCSSFTVSVRDERARQKDIGYVVASSDFSAWDFDRLSFSQEDRVRVTLTDSLRTFVARQVLLTQEVFGTPFAFDSLAYRYTIAGRVKERGKDDGSDIE